MNASLHSILKAASVALAAVTLSSSHAAELPPMQGVSADAKTSPQIRPTTGPTASLPGIETSGDGAALHLSPSVTLGDKGGVMFWIKLDRGYQSGDHVDAVKQNLLEAPGIFTLIFRNDGRSTALDWRWNKSLHTPPIVIDMPSLDGPRWYHVAFWWDAARGEFNGRLNGTPLRLAGTKVTPWTMKPIDKLTLDLKRFAVAGFTASAEPFTDEQLNAAVAKEFAGTADRALGCTPPQKVDWSALRGDPFLHRSLANPSDWADWVMEGPGKAELKDNRMVLRSANDESDAHFVFWCPVDLPDNFLAEWTFHPMSREGLCIAFFSARSLSGGSIFDSSLQKRDGLFEKYHSGDIACYHVSYFANNPANAPGRLTSNLRKDPGFHLVANGPAAVAPGDTRDHTMRILKQGSHVAFAVDDQQIFEFDDGGDRFGAALGGGKLGLRQMQPMVASYGDLNVFTLRANKH